MAMLQQFEQDMDHLVTMAGKEGLFLRTEISLIYAEMMRIHLDAYKLMWRATVGCVPLGVRVGISI